ncbi:MAG: DNA topoisomerase VI subunit B, partial [Candidatus Thorarchaeota archaeon]
MLSNSYSSQDIVELSVSAWFYRNRAIAGFDNPARSLYVAVREIVENSLDACEGARVLPEVSVHLSYETSDTDSIGFASGPEMFSLAVMDNGSGIARKDVPLLIGKMLTGTKFTHKQSRGTFGLGGSLALLYGQVTTQRPITVRTARKGESKVHTIQMRLDIENNQPEILHETEEEKELSEHGTTVSFHLQGDWLRSKRRIIDYFAQTSVIVPYATISLSDPDGNHHNFERLIEKLPKRPKEVKPHPRGIDVEMLKSMVNATKTTNLKTFLMKAFQRIGSSTADKFIEFSGLSPDIDPKNLPGKTLLHLMNSFSQFEGFMIPSAKALSPAGEEVLTAGMQRLDPEFLVVTQRAPSVYEGHPFIIEVGIAFGGNLGTGNKLYRFANRIPLLYDEGSDVSSRCIKEINLKSYGLRPEDPLAFFIHLCSTKVPYKTVGKEYI